MPFIENIFTADILDVGDLSDLANEVLDDICKKAPKGSMLEIEKWVHDVLIYNMEYKKTSSDSIHEAECLLRNQYGVCDGISKLASQMFDKLNIPSFVVFGDLQTGNDEWGGHAWNIVRIDGKWFHLDITSDLGLSSSKKHRRYDYFNLSDEEISTDHRFNRDRFPHKCSDSNSDYYTQNGFYCETVKDFDRLWDKALSSKEDWLVVKVPRCNKDDMNKLLCDHALKIALKYMNSASVKYSYNDARCIFEIQLERD